MGQDDYKQATELEIFDICLFSWVISAEDNRESSINIAFWTLSLTKQYHQIVSEFRRV